MFMNSGYEIVDKEAEINCVQKVAALPQRYFHTCWIKNHTEVISFLDYLCNIWPNFWSVVFQMCLYNIDLEVSSCFCPPHIGSRVSDCIVQLCSDWFSLRADWLPVMQINVWFDRAWRRSLLDHNVAKLKWLGAINIVYLTFGWWAQTSRGSLENHYSSSLKKDNWGGFLKRMPLFRSTSCEKDPSAH